LGLEYVVVRVRWVVVGDLRCVCVDLHVALTRVGPEVVESFACAAVRALPRGVRAAQDGPATGGPRRRGGGAARAACAGMPAWSGSR
jgi:hypothetical protein